MGYLFGADPCFLFHLCPTLAHSPGSCAGGFAGDCTVAWQKLSSQDGSFLAFPNFFKDAHKYSNHFLTGGWNSYFLCWSCGNVLVHTDKFPVCTLSTGVTIYNTNPICNLYPAVTFFKDLCRNGLYADAMCKGESHILLSFPFHLSPCSENSQSSGYQR